MRKFKLIKEYPSSPKVGIIVEESELMFVNSVIGYNIHRTLVLEYPEFWEEIKSEKNVEFDKPFMSVNEDGERVENYPYKTKECDNETKANCGTCKWKYKEYQSKCEACCSGDDKYEKDNYNEKTS